MHSYLEGLNPAQQEAVKNTEGPALVIAGAGSGKTRVLTYRIAHLLSLGTKPYNILSLTFTNKAAREMKDRIAQVVGDTNARNLWMGTFHSIFAKILRVESKYLGYPSSFTIYDSADSKSLIKTIVKEMRLDEKVYKPGDVLSRISSAKNDLCTPKAYARDEHRMNNDKASQKTMVYEIYARYMKQCFKSGVMDFDDLLLNTNILFRDHPPILEKYQKMFHYILVDEYQDTNISQYIIVKKLAEKHNNVCVVGDDAQSIYSFRGAKIENILNFRNDYPGYQMFKLEQNYRSTQTIVNAANSIIAKNKSQITKDIFSENQKGEKIKIIKAYSDVEEGYIVANDITEQHANAKEDFSNFAILYRTNAQSRIFEEALRKQSLPYKIYGGLSFYQRKEIKDLLAYFRMTVNPADNEALKRIINYPARGIGKTTLDKIIDASSQSGLPIWQVLTNQIKLPVNAGTQKKLNSFVSLIAGFQASLNQMPAYDLAMEVATQSGMIKDLYQDRSPENMSRQENLQELLNAIQEFSTNKIEEGEKPTLVNFLEEVSLLTDQDSDGEDDLNKVTMMTIHASKGLEFKNIYIVGMEEGLFPSPMASDSEKGLEEERRLFYVAVTRAEANATISFARSRYKYGELKFSKPSRFLMDIDPQFILMESADGVDNGLNKPSIPKFNTNPQSPQKQRTPLNFKQGKTDKKKVDFNFSSTQNSTIKEGMLIEHDRFGKGKVISIDGTSPNAKAIVMFQNAGQKQLLLKFAKLKILN